MDKTHEEHKHRPSSSLSPLSPDSSTLTSHFPLCSEDEKEDGQMRNMAWSGHNYIIFHFAPNEEKSQFLCTTFQKLFASSIVFFLAVMLRLLFCHCYMQIGLLHKKIDMGTIFKLEVRITFGKTVGWSGWIDQFIDGLVTVEFSKRMLNKLHLDTVEKAV